MGKGQSGTYWLNPSLRQFAALAIVSSSRFLVRWLSSELNPPDAPARGQKMVAQIVVSVEERVLLPKTSVYLICCSLPMLVILSPIILHQKYSKGGWDDTTPDVELMPMVENNSSIPSEYRNED